MMLEKNLRSDASFMKYTKFIIQYKSITVSGGIVAALLMSIFDGMEGFVFRAIVFEAIFSLFVIISSLFADWKLSSILFLVSVALSVPIWLLATQIG